MLSTLMPGPPFVFGALLVLLAILVAAFIPEQDSASAAAGGRSSASRRRKSAAASPHTGGSEGKTGTSVVGTGGAAGMLMDLKQSDLEMETTESESETEECSAPLIKGQIRVV